MLERYSDCYQTPVDKIYNPLNSVTPFFWDACCDKNNCLASNREMLTDRGWEKYNYLIEDMLTVREYFHAELDMPYCSLNTIFMNPPYSDPLPFVEKAWEDSKNFRVVMLLKADHSTKWYNYPLDRCEMFSMDQQATKEPIVRAYKSILGEMKYDKSQVGILHIRDRIKFYASEAMMLNDAHWNPGVNNKNLKYMNGQECSSPYGRGLHERILSETKNFKRLESGLIIAKNSGTFPSMIMILDRRGEK